MKISVQMRPCYGGFVLDPANDAARHLAAIARTKTLTTQALAHAAAAGMEVEVLDDPWGGPMRHKIASLASVYRANQEAA